MLFLDGLRFAKRWGLIVLRWLGETLAPVGRFLFRHVFVRLYGVLLTARRMLRRAGIVPHEQVLSLLTNRYVVHAAVIILSLGVSASSVFARDTQIADAGSRTLLFALLSGGGDDAEGLVIEDEMPPVYRPAGEGYLGEGVLRTRGGIDDDGEAFLPRRMPTVVDGSALHAIATPGDRRSTAARESTESYVVGAGDTLGSIAADFQVSVQTLLWANKLGPRDYLQIGQSLKIPAFDGVLHTVKKGDTVASIAKRYGADAEKIVVANRLGSGAELRVGEELIVPDGQPPAAPVVARVPRPIASVGSIFAPPSARDNRSTRLLWPSSGHAITQYYGGWENVRGWRIHTGIDIDGDYSSPIYAAEAGVVVFSGWGRGYGYHIDIDHGGGMITRYAHSSKLFAKVGQQVARGETIAMIGTTGFSTGTHLHFEVRIGGRPVNPISYIR